MSMHGKCNLGYRVDAAASRRGPRICAESGVGFGAKKPTIPTPKSKKQKQNVTIADGDEAVKKAVRLAGGNTAAPINQKQAAKGRIDYAKVKNWGSGKPAELGSLQVESFSAGKGPENKEQSFYAHLTYAVAQASEQGRVNQILHEELPVKARTELPDVPLWSLKQKRYVQYLVDQQAVHHVLELSIAEALAVDQESSNVAAALDCFSESRGLDRSLEIAADLTAIATTSPATPSGRASSPEPSAVAKSYEAYIKEIGRSAAEGADLDERNRACLRLIAHAYSIHMLLLTKGSTIGKTVADRLDLFKRKAINTYRSYPFDRMGKDPFEALKRNVKEAGTSLGEEEKETVVEELPRALAHSIQLWEALAFVD